MKDKLRALGLALAAIFAMSALIAQAAQAVETTEHTFNSEVSPYILTGGVDPKFADAFTAGSVTFTCTLVKFEGTVGKQESDEVTLTPTYGSTASPSGCLAGGQETTYHANHCAYAFDSDTVLTTKEPEEQEHAKAKIECSGATENEITITIPSLGITLHIPAQETISHGVRYTNIGEGSHRELTVHTTLKNIKGTCTGSCFLIGLAVGEFKTATYEGTETIAGYEDKGTEATGTAKTTPTLTEGAQVGIFTTSP
jgi:hypothetical protein